MAKFPLVPINQSLSANSSFISASSWTRVMYTLIFSPSSHFHHKKSRKTSSILIRRGFHKNNFSSLSTSAVRISTVLKWSRLPGFIGLIPPPALDKSSLLNFNSYHFTGIMSCSLNTVNMFSIVFILKIFLKNKKDHPLLLLSRMDDPFFSPSYPLLF
jgi:hypothetical protein